MRRRRYGYQRKVHGPGTNDLTIIVGYYPNDDLEWLIEVTVDYEPGQEKTWDDPPVPDGFRVTGIKWAEGKDMSDEPPKGPVPEHIIKELNIKDDSPDLYQDVLYALEMRCDDFDAAYDHYMEGKMDDYDDDDGEF